VSGFSTSVGFRGEPRTQAQPGMSEALQSEAGPADAVPADAVPIQGGQAGRVVAEDHVRLAEALVFASTDPVPARALGALLPEEVAAEDVLRAVQARYAGRGVELAQIAGGWQFRSAADLAPRLTRVIARPRRLPRVAMETLAIVAWHQPVTRAKIEEIRGASLGQPTLDALLEAGLVRSAGHLEVPGRPTLWATTPQFLQQFGLRDLKDLPRREELTTEQSVAHAEPAQGRLPTEKLAGGKAGEPVAGVDAAVIAGGGAALQDVGCTGPEAPASETPEPVAPDHLSSGA
jgi:segregation and condensation protein B